MRVPQHGDVEGAAAAGALGGHAVLGVVLVVKGMEGRETGETYFAAFFAEGLAYLCEGLGGEWSAGCENVS